MEIKEYFYLLKRKIETIISIVLVFFVSSLIFTVTQPFLYRSESRVIIVQNNPVAADPYVLSKANEYFGNILATVIHSDYFFNDVIKSGYEIDLNYFGTNKDEQIKNWVNTVDPKAVNDTGIISLAVYHKDKPLAI